MRPTKLFSIALLVALLAGLTLALRDPRVPLGVRGEWEWLRVSAPTDRAYFAFAAIAILAHAAFAWLGAKDALTSESQKYRVVRESAWVAGLLVSAVATQTLILSAAPEGHGLEKWAIALYNPGSSGYYVVAKETIRDPAAFLADYPDWIKTRDSLHIGTHPPGLLLIADGARRFVKGHTVVKDFLLDHLTNSTSHAFRALAEVPNAAARERLDSTDRAALALLGGLSLLACSATVVPLYLAARARGSRFDAWAGATIWPLVPAAILFQPIADAAYPLLTMTAIALCPRARSVIGPLLAGVVLAIGMQLSLAFLPAGLIAAIVLASSPETTRSRRLGLIVATGVGFLATTLAFWTLTKANPFAIWIENLRHHAHFFVEFPRTYRKWLVVAPIETAIAIGLPVSWAIARAMIFRKAPRLFWAGFATIALLHFSGRNLGEVARLWLPFFPPLLTAIGPGLDRRSPRASDLFILAILMGLQTLMMQGCIQVVYPDWETLKTP